METDAVAIERTFYTASLATKPQEIDALLDPLRLITSRPDASQPLTAAERESLGKVQQQLEFYLVNLEKIRSFTPDSLRLQIAQHLQGDVDRRPLLQLRIIICVAVVLAIAVALLPGLASVQQRIQSGAATAFSVLAVGAASLFLTALSAFRSELRRAFLFICAGVGLLGVSLLGQPIMEVFNLRQYPATSVLYSTPIFIAAILFHAGDALYVRLAGVKNWWTTVWPLAVAAPVVALITCLVPHPPTTESELIHDLVATIWGLMLLTPVASAIILPMVIRRFPELYKSSARQLWQALFPIIGVVAYQYIVRIVAGPFMEGPVAYVLFSMVTLMSLTLLRAGYAFNKVSRY